MRGGLLCETGRASQFLPLSGSTCCCIIYFFGQPQHFFHSSSASPLQINTQQGTVFWYLPSP